MTNCQYIKELGLGVATKWQVFCLFSKTNTDASYLNGDLQNQFKNLFFDTLSMVCDVMSGYLILLAFVCYIER